MMLRSAQGLGAYSVTLPYEGLVCGCLDYSLRREKKTIDRFINMHWMEARLEKSGKNSVSRNPRGPLAGIRVVEFAGLGPGPFACMLLADMGADIIRIERRGVGLDPRDATLRSRRQIELDLKADDDRRKALALVERADILVEGFRPGVMEKLGIGPDAAFERNPRLIYGRITGWGQEGPLKQAAGHDLNYIAISGALAAIGTRESPLPPLNFVGDYGGGALYLVVGVLAALLQARISGQGQVVDAAMCDGAASLSSILFVLKARGQWTTARASNFLDGAAPYYRTYRCADGEHISIAALEPQFYSELCRRLNRPDLDTSDREDARNWPRLAGEFESIFMSQTSAHWRALLEGTDACFAPVIPFDEAPQHPHNVARGNFLEVDGLCQPAPAPRFSKTPCSQPHALRQIADYDEALKDWS